jgi:circadian clock protein KaiC
MSDELRYDQKISSGIGGLDEVLGGGLPKDAMYLVQGNPGVGKTTFALRFLLEGTERGERAMYVSFSETKDELAAVGRSHGWPTDQLMMYEFLSEAKRTERSDDQTMFHPAEVELEETTRPLLEEVDRLKPSRIVIDSVSEIRLLARDPLRYRRQLLDLKQFFSDRGCTVLLVDDKIAARDEDIVQTVVHGIISLEKLTPLYGTTRRRLSVEKLRGVRYREGFHDYRIETGGIVVFPRLVAAEHRHAFSSEPMQSDVPELDNLLAGGIDRGTSTLIMGSAGTGKSSLAAQYAIAAAARGERSVIYTFEESVATWLSRETSLGMDPQRYIDSGHLHIAQIDPAELSPGELSARVRDWVERREAQLVVIDSINGYLQSVPEENFLLLHMHELLTYLGQQGVTTLLVMAQHGLLGPGMQSPVDVSYLADAVMLLRYFETAGEVRQVISVVKKRSGKHERTLREFHLARGGIRVGRPLDEFQGVLTGVPVYRGTDETLQRARDERVEP